MKQVFTKYDINSTFNYKTSISDYIDKFNDCQIPKDCLDIVSFYWILSLNCLKIAHISGCIEICAYFEINKFTPEIFV